MLECKASNMSYQETTSKVGRSRVFRRGTETELIAFRDCDPTTLLLLYEEPSVAAAAEPFRSGSFAVHVMIRAKENPVVAMASCMVGNHQWMLAKDALVLCVEPLRYLFALPGFFYGLVLHCSIKEQQRRTSEQIFSRFCMYRELGQGSSVLSGATRSDTAVWSHGCAEAIKLITSQATEREQPALAPATAASTVATSVTSGSSVIKKVQRAVRTSAVVKLLSRALLTGILDPRRHFHLTCPPGFLNMPSMSAIADLLEAIESGRQAVQFSQRLGDGGLLRDLWHINPEGIELMLASLSACSSAGARKRPRRVLDVLVEVPERACSG